MLYSRETLSSILEKERATTSVIEKPCPKTAFLSAAEGTVVTNFEVTRSREMDGKVSKTDEVGPGWPRIVERQRVMGPQVARLLFCIGEHGTLS
jgi:hypothetical protein